MKSLVLFWLPRCCGVSQEPWLSWLVPVQGPLATFPAALMLAVMHDPFVNEVTYSTYRVRRERQGKIRG